MKRNKHLKLMVFVIASLLFVCMGCSDLEVFDSETDDRLQEAISAYKQKKYSEAFHILEPLAEKGNSTAQAMLGELYYVGLGVSADCHKARSWFEKAAAGGNPTAYVYLGEIYEFGRCGETDFKKVISYNLKGIALGHVLAANNLAWFYATVQYPDYQKPKKAIEYALMAIKMDPYEARFYDTLAAAYARDGQFEKAIETVEKAITLLAGMDSIPAVEKQKLEAEFIIRRSLYMNRKPYSDMSIRYR